MRLSVRGRKQRGFSLIELMVGVALMGLVAMAIFSLYLTSQRSATSQSQVVDVQQNVRVALQQMTRDVRMAGFLLPPDADRLPGTPAALSGGNIFSLSLATSDGRAACVTADFTAPNLPTDTGDVSVGDGQVGLFDTSDHRYVRILRPFSRDQLENRVFQVVGTDPTASPPTITLKGFTSAIDYRSGDMIVGVTDPDADGDGDPNTNPASFPPTVQYSVANGQLLRNDGLGDQVVSDHIAGVAFTYLLDDGSSVSPATADQQEKIRAVQITITGTATTNGQQKNRSLTTVVRLRNR